MNKPMLQNADAVAELFRVAQTHHQGGQLAEAEAAYRELLNRDESHVGSMHGLATLFEQSGRSNLAAEAYAELGRVWVDQGRVAEAEQALRKCLALDGRHLAANSRLSLILWEWNQLDEAAEHAQWVVEQDENVALAWQTLGLVASRRYRYDKAIASLEKALALQPDLVLAHNYLGVCLNQMGRVDDALVHYEATLRLQPANPHAHFNRAIAWLTQGRFRDGWVEYEWRFQTGNTLRPAIPRPQWDGSPLDGKGILVHTEQGLGDVLQCVRLLPLLTARGARVVLACHTPLRPLLSRCEGIDDWFPIDEPGLINFDLKIPLLSLPGLLGIDERNCPADVPYVFPDPGRVEAWRPRIEALGGFKIGICWKGSPTYIGDALRSIPLAQFAPLAEMPGVTLVSLQRGVGAEEVREIGPAAKVHVLEGLDEEGGAMMDTAAVMQHLDLVVSADTAITHLAGALGRPVWLALSTSTDWRWLRGRSESPWYPTLRIFQQQALGDWPQVFADMTAALRNLVNSGESPARPTPSSLNPKPTAQAQSETVTIEIAPGELIDKITILEIKQARIADGAKLANIRTELAILSPHLDHLIAEVPVLAHHADELKSINETLWDVEDRIRECERSGNFGGRFIELARSVYRLNDRRASVKRAINLLLGSAIVEEKSYEDYGSDSE